MRLLWAPHVENSVFVIGLVKVSQGSWHRQGFEGCFSEVAIEHSPVPVITMLCIEPRTLSILGKRSTSLILSISLLAVVSGFSYLRLTIVQKSWVWNSRSEEFSSLNEVIWMTISHNVLSKTQWDSHAICILAAC